MPSCPSDSRWPADSAAGVGNPAIGDATLDNPTVAFPPVDDTVRKNIAGEMPCTASADVGALETAEDFPATIPIGTKLARDEMSTQVGRVLHLINGEHYSGAERVQDLLALQLPRFGYHVALACLKHGRFAEMREAREAPLLELAMRSRWDLSILQRLLQEIRQQHYHILHAHTPRTAMIGSLLSRLTGLPMVFHVHSPTSRDSTRRLQNWINDVVERRSLRRAARLIAVSHSLARHMQRAGHPAEKIAVVPNGVPVTTMLKRQPPSGPLVLGTVALFRPRKGIETLLEAVAKLHTTDCPLSLRAIGPFETRQYELHIKQLAQRLGVADRITWTGFTKDVTAELKKLDVFVLPSLFGEGLPMVVLEALAAGVPVIATRVEGVPEAIRDGMDGLLVQPGNSDAMARAIRRVASDTQLWQDLRVNGHARQRRSYSDISMARGVAQVYNDVLAER